MIKTGKVAKQIRIPKELYLKLKTCCAAQGKTLQYFYDDMLFWFFHNIAAKNTELKYLASHRNGYKHNVYFSSERLPTVQALSHSANVSEARVIYTALIYYLDAHKIESIPGVS